MTALIVGRDRLGSISKLLRERGFNEYIYWPRRKKGMHKKTIPDNVEM